MLVADLIRHNARARGANTALVVDGRRVTYAHLQQLIERTTAALHARGIGHGDRVAVLAKNSLEYVQLYFATAAMGAILVPMNFWHRAGEHEFTISDAEPALWFIEAMYDEVSAPVRVAHPELPVLRIPSPGGDRAEWDALHAAAGDVPSSVIDEDDPHMIMYTSGTTGRPKGAMFSQRRTVSDAFALGLMLRAEERDVLLHFSPPFHVGNWDNMKQFLLMGATVVLLREFDAEMALELIPTHRPTVMLGVPTMLNAIITHVNFAQTDVSSLRLIYYGAYDPSGILQRVADAFGAHEGRVQLAHTYGLTEGGPFVAWCPPEEVFTHWGSIGRAAPGVEIALLDDHGAEVPPGAAGEICVRGPRMSGYWRNDEATAVTLADGWLHTGDVAVADPDGFLTIVDRKKDMIRTGGQNVWSKQVENHLLEHPAVADVAVIGLFDAVYEEQVAAVVVPAQPPSDELAGELIAFVRAGMAGYNTPKSLYFVDELPKTTLGKVRKDMLRDRFATGGPTHPTEFDVTKTQG